MSAAPCLRFVAGPFGQGGRCLECGGTRTEHEGRAKPTAGARLPTPEEAAARIGRRCLDGEESAHEAITERDAALLARLDAAMERLRRHRPEDALPLLDALCDELRGGS